MTNSKDLLRIERLVENYGEECALNNEYDNRKNVAEAKKKLMEAIRSILSRNS